MNEFVEIAPGLHVRRDFMDCFKSLGINTFDDVFAYNGDENLYKENLAPFRQRIMFKTAQPETTLFMKRYVNVPKSKQLSSWLSHRKILSTMSRDLEPALALLKEKIAVPETVAFGVEFKGIFEKRSFIVTKKIENSESLERKLPQSFFDDRKSFIKKLAAFIRKFHAAGFRHRDLYLCHIFCSSNDEFTLIDLHRVFKPVIFAKKYRIKDLAQLYYSTPADIVSRSERLRFLRYYLGKDKLTKSDKILIKRIKQKAKRMSRHDKKHGRVSPFEK